MIIGEIGPVEIELIYGLIFFVTGSFLGGPEFYGINLSEITGVQNGFLQAVTLRKLLAMISVVLIVLFVIDNLKEALEKNY